MASKTLLARLLAGALLLAGCATARKEPASAQPAVQTVAPPRTQAVAEQAAPKRTPQTAAKPPSTRQKPQPVSPNMTRAELPGMIGADAKWTAPGFQSLAVSRGPLPQQPVPIFRQAGTLASVRAALAGSPAQPQAEFRNGVLTLKFDRGSNEEIAAAVNKTLSITASRNLQVTLQP